MPKVLTFKYVVECLNCGAIWKEKKLTPQIRSWKQGHLHREYVCSDCGETKFDINLYNDWLVKNEEDFED